MLTPEVRNKRIVIQLKRIREFRINLVITKKIFSKIYFIDLIT